MSTVSYAALVRGNRSFRYYWGGQIVSQLGDWFSAITVQALLQSYTNSTTSLFWFMVAQLLPHLVLSPVAGMVVDRLPRKTVMIGADLARALIALGLLAFRGPETVWVAYACVAGLSTFSAYFEPARIATLPNITSKEELVTANALTSVTWSLLLTSGALVGGIVARFAGVEATFILNAVSFLCSAALLTRMQVRTVEGGGEHAAGLRGLAEGFSYVVARPHVMGALTAKLGWGLAGGVQTLIPFFGGRVFRLPNDPEGQLSISVLFAAGGIGTALGPVFARRFAGRDLPRMRWAIAVSFLAAGVYYACMAAAPNLFTTGLFLLLSRMHGAVVWVFSTVLLQSLVEDRYRGRVFAAEGALFTLTMLLSSLATTRAMDEYHVPYTTVTLALAATSLVVGVGWVLMLARHRRQDAAAAEREPAPGAAE